MLIDAGIGPHVFKCTFLKGALCRTLGQREPSHIHHRAVWSTLNKLWQLNKQTLRCENKVVDQRQEVEQNKVHHG